LIRLLSILLPQLVDHLWQHVVPKAPAFSGEFPAERLRGKVNQPQEMSYSGRVGVLKGSPGNQPVGKKKRRHGDGGAWH